MKRYGFLYLKEDSLFNVNIFLKKGKIHIKDFIEDNISKDLFKITPFGAYAQDLKALNEKLELLFKDKKTKKWCLILPDSWQKCLYLEEENIPKKTKELKTFIEWHFKKSYNLKPEEVRFSYVLKNQNGKNKLLITFSLEKLISSLETIFNNNNMHLGFIISSFWALSFLIPKKGIWALLNIEKDTWTLGIFEEDQLLSFRQKIIPVGNLSILNEEIDRTLKLNQKPIDYFYFNFNNSEIEKNVYTINYNLLKPTLENIIFMNDTPIWWENLGNIFLGALYGLS